MSTSESQMLLLGPATKADAAYQELRARIVDARLPPGSRLDQELLASSLGVSTTPLREALRRLEAERLVERAAHKEVVIAPLSRTELTELYQARIELDALAVRLAADALMPEELEEARRLLAQPGSREPQASLRENRAFHRVLYVASHNRVVVEMLDWLWDRSDRYRFVLATDRHQLVTAKREHETILRAVASGKGDRAAELMQRHLRESEATIDALLPTSGLDT